MNELSPLYRWQSREVAPQEPVTISLAAFIATSGLTLGTSLTIASIIVSVASSLAISAISALVSGAFSQGRPRAEDIKRELRREQSLPFYRNVYGRVYAPGSPAPWRVKGNELYGCLILNSRESDGGALSVRIDGRDVDLGDVENLFDFSSSGAVATNAPFAGFARFWVGLGDQTSPPDDVLSEAGTIFQATDAWNGLTVIWCAFNVGPNATRLDRWPSSPPSVEVRMNYSKVWDPRDVAQSFADPSSWTYSANQALCAMDGHTQNPLQRFQPGDLVIDDWIVAANVSDEAIPLAIGGTEPRYEVNGIVVFNNAELSTLLAPLFEAGASERLVIGGQTSIVPGAYQQPGETVTDIISDSLSFERLQPGRDLANSITVTYVNPDRSEESAELPPYSVPGAIAEDGGIPSERRVELPMVTSPTQAARIQKIVAYRARAQRKIFGTLPPTNANAVAGAAVNVEFPDPFAKMNGVYQVQEITPQVFPEDGGVSMSMPAVMLEYSAEAYDWDTSEEPIIPDPVEVVTGGEIAAPANFAATSTSITSGGSTIVQVVLTWTPVAAEIVRYETRFRKSGDPSFRLGPVVDPDIRDASGDVFTVIEPLEAMVNYDFRVRSQGIGRVSEWVDIVDFTVSPPSASISAPVNGAATSSGTTSIDVQFTLPNDGEVIGINFYAGDTADTGTMALLSGPIFATGNEVVGVVETGLTASQTRFYAARSVDAFDQESSFSATVSATTDS